MVAFFLRPHSARRFPDGVLELVAGLCLTAWSAPALAQETVAEVTDAQISAYQIGLEAGCKRVARGRGESQDQADAYCGCVMQVLQTNATPTQWRQATFAFLKHRSADEAMALSEHTLKFQACKAAAP